MRKSKQLGAAAALVSGVILAGPATAGLSGNVAATSDYMFRGLSQSGGAAVQGGVDYASDSGLYVGTWVSNINFGGGTEQDIYVGYGTEISGVGVDISALYYWYPEEDSGTGGECSTLELGLGVSFGPLSLGAAYADETHFFLCDGLGEAALYLSAGLGIGLTDSLSLDISIGQYSGDEIERSGVNGTDDSYFDYAIGVSSELQGGYGVAFQYVGTDIDDDDPKLVVSFSKSFDL